MVPVPDQVPARLWNGPNRFGHALLRLRLGCHERHPGRQRDAP